MPFKNTARHHKMGLVWGCSGLVWFSRHFTEDFSLPVCHSDQSKVVKIYISFPLQPILNIYKKSIIISASQKVLKQLFAFIIGKESYDFICTISWMFHKYDDKEENNLKCVSGLFNINKRLAENLIRYLYTVSF
jgi:hypothetical protein